MVKKDQRKGSKTIRKTNASWFIQHRSNTRWTCWIMLSTLGIRMIRTKSTVSSRLLAPYTMAWIFIVKPQTFPFLRSWHFSCTWVPDRELTCGRLRIEFSKAICNAFRTWRTIQSTSCVWMDPAKSTFWTEKTTSNAGAWALIVNT